MYKNIFFLLCLCFQFCLAQNKALLYNFTEIPQSLNLNPGLITTTKWHVGVPALSHFSFNLGSSHINLMDLINEKNIFDNLRGVMQDISYKKDVSLTQQLELLNVGFKTKNNYFYSFGVYQELDFILYWPKDLLILTLDRNIDHLNRRFNLNHLRTSMDASIVFHFGINKKIRKNLTVGARLKWYNSLFNLHIKNKGSFRTTVKQNGRFASTFSGDIKFRNSTIFSQGVDDILDDILTRGLRGNKGIGIDIGFTKEINRQVLWTASLLDLGMIFNNKNLTTLRLRGDATQENQKQGLPIDQKPSDGFWRSYLIDILRDDIISSVLPETPPEVSSSNSVEFDFSKKSYVTFRPFKFYSSIQYNYGEIGGCDCLLDGKKFHYRNSVGGHLYMVSRPRGPEFALSLFYQKRLGKFLNLKTTYSVDRHSFKNIGFGMSLHLGKFNFYILGEHLLEYPNLSSEISAASLQFGFNISAINYLKK